MRTKRTFFSLLVLVHSEELGRQNSCGPADRDAIRRVTSAGPCKIDKIGQNAGWVKKKE